MTRIYKLDNTKALLIFFVVVGHLLTAYVNRYYSTRWMTLWIYTFHMPAFIFISGLLRKKIEKFNWGRFIGLILCAYSLKLVLYLTRLALSKDPDWSWFVEASTPWYLFALAEYELFFYATKKLKPKYVIAITVLMSLCVGYVRMGSFLCLSRAINFMPLFALGYYLDPKELCEKIEKGKTAGWIIMIVSVIVCFFAAERFYEMRYWFTNRRSYHYLNDFFNDDILPYAWAIRLGILVIEICLSFALISIMPQKKTRISIIGERSVNIYYWHRSLVLLLVNMAWLPQICEASNELLMILSGFILSAIITVLLTFDIFSHPTSDILKLTKSFFAFLSEKRKAVKS